jgi:hypothetical protein
MRGYILVFQLPSNKKNAEISKFCQKFYGQDTSSWGGKYNYHRHGLMDDIPYRKLSRGVIIIKKKYLDIVLKFLEEYNAQVYVREIILTEDDKNIL